MCPPKKTAHPPEIGRNPLLPHPLRRCLSQAWLWSPIAAAVPEAYRPVRSAGSARPGGDRSCLGFRRQECSTCDPRAYDPRSGSLMTASSVPGRWLVGHLWTSVPVPNRDRPCRSRGARPAARVSRARPVRRTEPDPAAAERRAVWASMQSADSARTASGELPGCHPVPLRSEQKAWAAREAIQSVPLVGPGPPENRSGPCLAENDQSRPPNRSSRRVACRGDRPCPAEWSGDRSRSHLRDRRMGESNRLWNRLRWRPGPADRDSSRKQRSAERSSSRTGAGSRRRTAADRPELVPDIREHNRDCVGRRGSIRPSVCRRFRRTAPVCDRSADRCPSARSTRHRAHSSRQTARSTGVRMPVEPPASSQVLP